MTSKISSLILVTLSLALSAVTEPSRPVLPRASILQTQIVPYIQSEDSGQQIQSTQEQLAETQTQLEQTQTQLESSQEELSEARQDLSETDVLLQATTASYLDALTDITSINDELVTTQGSYLDALGDITSAQDLLYDPAVPYASEIDFALASLFSSTPYAGQNLSEPLLTQLNNSLIPYLQAALAKLGDLNKIVQIACGETHTLVLTSAGKVYATGDNTFGQLGTGNNTTTNILTAMIGAGSSDCTAIAVGSYHSVVLKNTGAVYATGNNFSGQLGTGNNDNTNVLTAMVGVGASGCTAIAAGGGHSVVLKDTGTVYATGNNSNGELGTGNNDNTNILTGMVGAGSSDCTAIAAGGIHSVILKNTGAVYATGYNTYGELGTGNNDNTNILTGMVGAGSSDCTAIAGGAYHSIVLKNTGAAYATGYNTDGQLGIGNNSNTNTLTAMIGEGTSGCIAIAGGVYHSVVLKDSGTVFAAGNNSNGQLGTGNNTTTNILTAMVGEGASGCTDIAAGILYSAVLKDTGAVYATGNNGSGQLGTGNNTTTNTLKAMVNSKYLPLY